MEDAGLQMEVGMLNMCMAMVTARAQMVKNIPHMPGVQYLKVLGIESRY
jgi:hypothetical protein